MQRERSRFVFSLAESCGISLTDSTAEISLESFELFKSQYAPLAEERDKAISEHVNSCPKLFRTFIPYSSRAWVRASQVAWYFDEILVRDPIDLRLNTPNSFEPQPRELLKQLLLSMHHFRDLIDEGFLLPYGRGVVPNVYEPAEKEFELIADVPAVREALMNAVRCGRTDVVYPNLGEMTVVNFTLDSGGSTLAKLRNVPFSKNKPNVILLSDSLPQIATEEAMRLFEIDDNLSQVMRPIFGTEVRRTIRAMASAMELNAAAMFDRSLDATILEHAAADLSETRQSANVQLLNLILPFVRNAPAERLVELRRAAPNAFIEFRGRLWELVSSCIENGVTDQALITEKVAKEIASQTNTLETELEAEIRKWNILGRGLSLVAGAGILAGSSLGLPMTGLITLGIGGVGSAITAYAETNKAKTKAERHPFYLIWKAQTESES